MSRARKPPIRRSGFEDKIAANLTKAGVPFEYEKRKLSYTSPSKKHIYTPDFELPNGVIVEAKGKFDADARAKMVLVKKEHPELDIRILFQRDNTLRKGSKTRYSTWAQKNGFIYHVDDSGNIPEEWITKDTQKNDD